MSDSVQFAPDDRRIKGEFEEYDSEENPEMQGSEGPQTDSAQI